MGFLSKQLFVFFTILFSLFSWRALRFLGTVLGLFWFRVLRIRRTTVLENLQKVMGENQQQNIRIAQSAYIKTCINVLELFKMRSARREILDTVSVAGMGNYQQALKKGKGVLVVTAHMGNFDLLACSQSLSGVPLAIVSKSLHASALNQYWMDTRSEMGLQIFPSDKRPRQVLSWLRSGKVLGLVVDQRVSEQNGGIEVPFFGYNVWTAKSAAQLAVHTGAAVVPVMIFRTETGQHQIVIEPELEISRQKNSKNEREITAQINRRVEEWIVRHSDDWMWLHRRFKNSKEIKLL